MTNLRNIIWIMMLSSTFFFNCTENDEVKDNKLLFKNTVWTGEFNYTNMPAQPVSIEFKEGGLLTWYDLSGETSGIWVIEDKEISITLVGNTGFRSGISKDNEFINIEDFEGNDWHMISGALNTLPDESLDDTKWSTTNLVLTFKVNEKVDAGLGPNQAVLYSDAVYIKKAKCIRFTYPQYKFFTVLTSDLEMNGINQPTGDPMIYPFKVIKD